MTPRRAVVVGAVTGSALGLIVGIQLVRAELMLRYAEKSLRRFTRLLRNDRWRRDRYRLDPEQLQQDGAQEVTAPAWPAASRHHPRNLTREELAALGIDQ